MFQRYHQNSQMVLGATGMNGLTQQHTNGLRHVEIPWHLDTIFQEKINWNNVDEGLFDQPFWNISKITIFGDFVVRPIFCV